MYLKNTANDFEKLDIMWNTINKVADLYESQLALSDVNDDGEVNIADALMISRFDAGLIDKF